jgi:hypothetical protein
MWYVLVGTVRYQRSRKNDTSDLRQNLSNLRKRQFSTQNFTFSVARGTDNTVKSMTCVTYLAKSAMYIIKHSPLTTTLWTSNTTRKWSQVSLTIDIWLVQFFGIAGVVSGVIGCPETISNTWWHTLGLHWYPFVHCKFKTCYHETTNSNFLSLKENFTFTRREKTA